MRTLDTLLRTRLGMPPLCVRCDTPMKIKTITPTMFTTTIDEVVFRCPDCEQTTKSIMRAPQLAASQASRTPTISRISQGRSIVPVAIAEVTRSIL
jgi:hypothetical protein